MPVRDASFELLLSRPGLTGRQLDEGLAALGVDHTRPHVVVVATAGDGSADRALERAKGWAGARSGLACLLDERLVLLLPGEDAGGAAHTVSAELTHSLGHPVTAGDAGPVTGSAPLDGVYREALRCLEAVTALSGAGQSAAPEDLGFLGVLLGEKQDVDGYITSVIGPLLEHDARRFTTLARTLETYFATGSSRTRAAEELYVHPNTVSRRLERITTLLPGWQEPAKALEIQLALRLLRARHTLESR